MSIMKLYSAFILNVLNRTIFHGTLSSKKFVNPVENLNLLLEEQQNEINF